ncbi:MAG: hypothetical protein JRH16_07800 [Deltaproteobacteria bacterium]|nr:hypothetical protein [Deltaproteobacteria bacterium]
MIVTTGQHSYEFTATVGDHIELRIADTGPTAFSPRIELRSPSDLLIATDADCCVAEIAHDVAETGTFSVLVEDNFSAGGSYTLYYARIPGANEHGSLINDGVHSETIDLGDLDSYTLTASIGDHIELRLAEINTTTLSPQLALYAPSGALIAIHADCCVAKIAHTAAEPGTFTVLIKDGQQNSRGFGDYNLYFARIPGANEHGPLTDGIAHPGTIDLGDLDTFTLVAAMGETISLELEKTSGTWSGRLELYDPSGAFIALAQDSGTAFLDELAAESGTYTVLVKDGTQAPRFFGDYILTCTAGCHATAVPTIPLRLLPLLAAAIAWTGFRRAASMAHHAAAE